MRHPRGLIATALLLCLGAVPLRADVVMRFTITAEETAPDSSALSATVLMREAGDTLNQVFPNPDDWPFNWDFWNVDIAVEDGNGDRWETQELFEAETGTWTLVVAAQHLSSFRLTWPAADAASNPLILPAGKELRLSGPTDAWYTGTTYDVDMDEVSQLPADLTNDTGAGALYHFTVTYGDDTEPYHSADYDGTKWVISPLEVLRVINLYKANGYQIDTSQGAHPDGYATGAGATPASGYHSADYDSTKWVISPLEVLRVINLYKANGYHVDTGADPHPDGYATGPVP